MIHPQTVLPPRCHIVSPGHVVAPRLVPSVLRVERLETARPMRTSTSGPVLHARQTSLPESTSSAAMKPRTPISPPLLPTNTLLPTTSGAIVIVWPVATSPSWVRQIAVRSTAFTATVVLSRTL